MTTIAEKSALLDFRPVLQQSPSDQRAILNIRNESEIRRNMYRHTPISEIEHNAWISELKRRKDIEYFLIYNDNKLIGALGFTSIDVDNGRADWAFYLTAEIRGQRLGAGTEYAALNYAFKKLALNKLNCEVIAWNTGVIRLHRSFGFLQEGIRRAHVKREDGVHDVVLLGITAQEWQEKRGEFE